MQMSREARESFSDSLLLFIKKHPYLTSAVACLSLCFFDQTAPARPAPSQLGFIIVYAILLSCTFMWLFTKSAPRARVALCIAALGFALRLAYCVMLTATTWTHDVGTFPSVSGSQTIGHAAYIESLFNGSLPALNPADTGQFYHPPLHHFIAALWMRVQTALGIRYGQAAENVQLLSLFYSFCCVITTYKIAAELRLKTAGASIAVAYSALHPTFIILAASVNNDMLCITLMYSAVLCTVRWYKNPTLRGILKLALAIGLSMMTKLSGAYVAPAVAAVFLIKLISSALSKNRAQKKPPALIGQFAAFGALCIPLGLWWGVRNMILYGLPITYVAELPRGLFTYIGQYTASERWLDFSNYKNALTSSGWWVYSRGVTLDWNIPLAVFKTALYGEYTLGWGVPVCEAAAPVLLFSSVVLAACGFLSMLFFTVRSVVACVRGRGDDGNIFELFLFMLYAVIMTLFIKFCFDYPHNCTMDFRYIVPVLLISGVFTAKSCDSLLSYAGGKRTGAASVASVVTASLILAAAAVFFLSAVIFYVAGMAAK